jgi:hypothetical protein
MSDEASALAPTADAHPIIQFRYLWWAMASILVMIVAIQSRHFWFLTFVHILSGILWTGIDLFMGFVIGPTLRQMDTDSRRAFVNRLVQRMIFLMPTLGILTTTSGWFLASRMGFFSLPFPEFGWIVAALAVVTLLKIQGFGVLLPLELRVIFELRKPNPDLDQVGRWMRRFVRVVAFQGVMQVGIIVIMTKLRTGL